MNKSPAERLTVKERYTLFGMPAGYDSVFLADLARKSAHPILHIATDDVSFEQMVENLRFFAPDIDVLRFPAWDCLPYDRVSPTSEVMGERLKALAMIVHRQDIKPLILVTTIAAATQRIVPRAFFNHGSFHIQTGKELKIRQLQSFLVANGYHRTETVREPGEYAIRGGLIDIFPAGYAAPCRIDCFGEEVEKVKNFDALTQRTTDERQELLLYPAAEALLTPESTFRFRGNYRDLFGTLKEDDPLYEAMGACQPYAGMEHWLPLFYDRLETLFDYVPEATVTLDHQLEQSRDVRFKQVEDLFQARQSMAQASSYHPVPMESLYVSAADWHRLLGQYEVVDFSPFAGSQGTRDAGGRKGRDFGDIRAQNTNDLYETVRDHVLKLKKSTKRILVASYSLGAKDRLQGIFQQSNITEVEHVVLPLERGFESPDISVLTEQDILGDRLTRLSKKKKKSDAFVFEISQLHEGDFVVHEEHGIGQFEKLETLVVDYVPHDCLKILYAGGDKLFVPVENLDVLSRYGSAEAGAVLDKLGGAAWQARRARVKKDLLALAQELLKIAAARILNHTDPIHAANDNSYEKFCARFPYPETEDQQKAIDDVLEDLEKDHAMDRLVCGDVGFGKTEVALRAAAMTALAGHQVALIAPTTLLARQHYQTFLKRFQGFPIKIGLLSRFVSAKESQKVHEGLQSGDVRIVIGTHALLSEKIKFSGLALLIVDEEQKFGVKQKERLKEIKENVHVLTLTATPIPRTLQMALAGVRELSLITTAPMDRLAVKTFVLPYDPVVIRDALMREHYRGGQTFYVCPRIADLQDLEQSLKALVPELKIVIAHGQMAAEEMEEKMTHFYEGAFDILLSTNIVESGLDIPNANTMIIHRADMFGLSQLYQLRGRIGRSKQRAYAYLTYEPNKKLTKSAEQRLHAIEQLDTLGAGFQLASHDLDIRGAGNLLGEEQSGHIREIGVELYQEMLEEAVATAKTAALPKSKEGTRISDASFIPELFSPNINMGMPVLIPDTYVSDMNLRLSIYRRIADLQDRSEIESFAAEMIDRFGPLPKDVENLLDLVEIKQLCRIAGVERFDAGPKGAVVALHPSSRIDIVKLVAYISKLPGTAKIRPEDQKLVYMRAWDDVAQRIKGAHKILKELIALI